MVKFLKILQRASSLCHVVKLSTLQANFCPRCILTFSKTSSDQDWLSHRAILASREMMGLSSSMSSFRSSFQGKNITTSP
ncbi:hypothetical protein TNCT_312241 [Trichonephila clavata]|uniref:Uncharacterized protein n=1 Tax=Trichonephila clavata TaxID=2740835 RepID=A0A8X6HGU9_TRICU|nr:hypothetical protein TNCT_312241 [Trichonephila clavata]